MIATVPATTPLTIISSVTVLQWVRADLGVTIGTNVSAWADQSGNTRDYAQATGGKQPTLTAADATLNNQATITFDGVDDNLDAATFTPGAQPLFIWAVVKQLAWTSLKTVFGDSTASHFAVIQLTASPQIGQTNGTQVNANGGAALSSWVRMEASFTASVADYVKLGATTVTGASAGANATSTGRRIACNAGGTTFTNIVLAELLYCSGKPSAGELTALDAYVTSRYGAGLV